MSEAKDLESGRIMNRAVIALFGASGNHIQILTHEKVYFLIWPRTCGSTHFVLPPALSYTPLLVFSSSHFSQ